MTTSLDLLAGKALDVVFGGVRDAVEAFVRNDALGRLLVVLHHEFGSETRLGRDEFYAWRRDEPLRDALQAAIDGRHPGTPEAMDGLAALVGARLHRTATEERPALSERIAREAARAAPAVLRDPREVGVLIAGKLDVLAIDHAARHRTLLEKFDRLHCAIKVMAAETGLRPDAVRDGFAIDAPHDISDAMRELAAVVVHESDAAIADAERRAHHAVLVAEAVLRALGDGRASNAPRAPSSEASTGRPPTRSGCSALPPRRSARRFAPAHSGTGRIGFHATMSARFSRALCRLTPPPTNRSPSRGAHGAPTPVLA
jgi:hypothetical protein